MNYLLVLVLLFLLGTLLAARPSPRARAQARMRSRALKLGLSVQVRDSPELKLLPGQIAYCLSWPEKVPFTSWRLAPGDSLNLPLPTGQRRSSDPAHWNLPGWVEQGHLPALNGGQLKFLLPLLQALPDCTDAVVAADQRLAVVWKERDPGGVEAIGQLLAGLGQCLVEAARPQRQ